MAYKLYTVMRYRLTSDEVVSRQIGGVVTDKNQAQQIMLDDVRVVAADHPQHNEFGVRFVSDDASVIIGAQQAACLLTDADIYWQISVFTPFSLPWCTVGTEVHGYDTGTVVKIERLSNDYCYHVEKDGQITKSSAFCIVPTDAIQVHATNYGLVLTYPSHCNS